MATKQHFVEYVEKANNMFADWFNNQPELVAMFRAMTAKQQAEFRARMITLLATGLQTISK